eukprot:g17018.t1
MLREQAMLSDKIARDFANDEQFFVMVTAASEFQLLPRFERLKASVARFLNFQTVVYFDALRAHLSQRSNVTPKLEGGSEAGTAPAPGEPLTNERERKTVVERLHGPGCVEDWCLNAVNSGNDRASAYFEDKACKSHAPLEVALLEVEKHVPKIDYTDIDQPVSGLGEAAALATVRVRHYHDFDWKNFLKENKLRPLDPLNEEGVAALEKGDDLFLSHETEGLCKVYVENKGSEKQLAPGQTERQTLLTVRAHPAYWREDFGPLFLGSDTSHALRTKAEIPGGEEEKLGVLNNPGESFQLSLPLAAASGVTMKRAVLRLEVGQALQVNDWLARGGKAVAGWFRGRKRSLAKMWSPNIPNPTRECRTGRISSSNGPSTDATTSTAPRAVYKEWSRVYEGGHGHEGYEISADQSVKWVHWRNLLTQLAGKPALQQWTATVSAFIDALDAYTEVMGLGHAEKLPERKPFGRRIQEHFRETLASVQETVDANTDTQLAVVSKHGGWTSHGSARMSWDKHTYETYFLMHEGFCKVLDMGTFFVDLAYSVSSHGII